MEPLLRKHERDGARLYYQIGRAFALMGPHNWPLWLPEFAAATNHSTNTENVSLVMKVLHHVNTYPSMYA